MNVRRVGPGRSTSLNAFDYVVVARISPHQVSACLHADGRLIHNELKFIESGDVYGNNYGKEVMGVLAHCGHTYWTTLCDRIIFPVSKKELKLINHAALGNP
jgi:hypothetical protein